MRRRRALVVVLALGFVAGCGSDVSSRATGIAPLERLARNGISVSVPEGWDGRVMFREPTGRDGVMLQVANFVLPANEGLEPPRELPPGEEDPIKAMGSGHALVMIGEPASWDRTPDPGAGPPAPEPLTVADLTPVNGPRIPVGHSLAEGSFCFGSRCLEVEVDFGAAHPADALVQRVDDVLASLAVAG